MDQQPDPGGLTAGQHGFATLQNVIAAGIAMVFFAVLANLVVMQYTVGVMTAATDDGARLGSRSVAPLAACEARALDTIAAVAGGSLRDPAVECRLDGGWIIARASGTLLAWAPLVPEFAAERESRAPLEDVAP